MTPTMRLLGFWTNTSGLTAMTFHGARRCTFTFRLSASPSDLGLCNLRQPALSPGPVPWPRDGPKSGTPEWLKEALRWILTAIGGPQCAREGRESRARADKKTLHETSSDVERSRSARGARGSPARRRSGATLPPQVSPEDRPGIGQAVDALCGSHGADDNI